MSLDPQTTLALQEARRAQDAPSAPELEPPFPYDKLHFDPFYFKADREVDTTRDGAT